MLLFLKKKINQYDFKPENISYIHQLVSFGR